MIRIGKFVSIFSTGAFTAVIADRYIQHRTSSKSSTLYTKLVPQTSTIPNPTPSLSELGDTFTSKTSKTHNFNANFIADAVENVLDKVVNIVVPLDSQTGYFYRKTANQVSSGSGFFVHNSDGTILTNAHVVSDISADATVQVTTSDGVNHSGFVYSLDPFSDLAVIKLVNEGNVKFDPVKFGENSDLRAGDWVVAVGSPLGLQNTVTAGVVSSRRRNKNEIGSEEGKDGRVDYIQTDCVVHAGSSGGPLLNMKGEVIGLVTTRAAENEGITVDNVMGIIQQLITTGRVIRPWLGLRMVSLTPNVIQQLEEIENRPDRSDGVFITSVVADSPAERGGLLEGDVVFKINGKPVAKTYEFLKSLGHKIGEVQLDVERRVPLDVDWDGRVTNYANETLKLRIRPQEMNLKDENIHFH